MVHASGKDDFAAGDSYVDIGCIDKRIIAEAVVHVFFYAVIGTCIIAGTLSAMISIGFSPSCGVIIAKP